MPFTALLPTPTSPTQPVRCGGGGTPAGSLVPGELHIAHRRADAALIMTVAGEIDARTAPILQTAAQPSTIPRPGAHRGSDRRHLPRLSWPGGVAAGNRAGPAQAGAPAARGRRQPTTGDPPDRDHRSGPTAHPVPHRGRCAGHPGGLPPNAKPHAHPGSPISDQQPSCSDVFRNVRTEVHSVADTASRHLFGGPVLLPVTSPRASSRLYLDKGQQEPNVHSDSVWTVDLAPGRIGCGYGLPQLCDTVFRSAHVRA